MTELFISHLLKRLQQFPKSMFVFRWSICQRWIYKGLHTQFASSAAIGAQNGEQR